MGESLRFSRYMRAARAWPGIEATDQSPFCAVDQQEERDRNRVGNVHGFLLLPQTPRFTCPALSRSIPCQPPATVVDQGNPNLPGGLNDIIRLYPRDPAPGAHTNPEAADSWAAPEAGPITPAERPVPYASEAPVEAGGLSDHPRVGTACCLRDRHHHRPLVRHRGRRAAGHPRPNIHQRNGPCRCRNNRSCGRPERRFLRAARTVSSALSPSTGTRETAPQTGQTLAVSFKP